VAPFLLRWLDRQKAKQDRKPARACTHAGAWPAVSAPVPAPAASKTCSVSFLAGLWAVARTGKLHVGGRFTLLHTDIRSVPEHQHTGSPAHREGRGTGLDWTGLDSDPRDGSMEHRRRTPYRAIQIWPCTPATEAADSDPRRHARLGIAWSGVQDPAKISISPDLTIARAGAVS